MADAGKPIWKKWWFWAIVVVVLGAIGRNMDKSGARGAASDKSSTVVAASQRGNAPAPAAPAKVATALPSDQQAFASAVEGFYGPYDDAPNELKKSALRVQRKSAIEQSLPELTVSNWIGTLDEMGTNSEGKAYIAVKLGGAKSITIKTWNNALSDSGDRTLIENGSALYGTLGDLSEGTRIRFSGEFLAGEKDHVREGSMSEHGAMTDPEFLMRFSAVTPTN
jgi:hypothetical protein